MAEFEHALICLGEAFGRYNLQGLAGASGDTSFSGQDNMVLHIIATLDRPKSLSDISRFMNRDDLANIQYSVRKLLKAGLIEKASDRSARGTTYRSTAAGRAAVAEFDGDAPLRRQLAAVMAAVTTSQPTVVGKSIGTPERVWRRGPRDS